MIHLKLGEAYEALGEISLSVENYEQAEILFPMARWKAEARAGVERAKRKEKEHEATGLTPVPPQETRTMAPGPQDAAECFRASRREGSEEWFRRASRQGNIGNLVGGQGVG